MITSRPCDLWTYIHFVLEDLYYLAGIFGLLVVGFNIKAFIKANEDESIKKSDKAKELSDNFSNLSKEWKNLRHSFEETIKDKNISWIRTNNYQNILEAQDKNDTTYFITTSDGIEEEVETIKVFIKKFEDFSRSFLLFKRFEGIIEKKEFLEIYSNLYSFKKNIKTENADKLFKKFSNLYTKEIQKLAKE